MMNEGCATLITVDLAYMEIFSPLSLRLVAIPPDVTKCDGRKSDIQQVTVWLR